jgi:hypothetical protein
MICSLTFWEVCLSQVCPSLTFFSGGLKSILLLIIGEGWWSVDALLRIWNLTIHLYNWDRRVCVLDVECMESLV